MSASRIFAPTVRDENFDLVTKLPNECQELIETVLDLRLSLAKVHISPPSDVTRKSHHVMVAPEVLLKLALHVG